MATTMIWVVVYCLVTLAVLVLGFTSRRHRRWIRIGIIMLSAPILIIAVGVVVVRFTVFREPPTLVELKQDYPVKRAKLETILQMSDEDAKFTRIAVTFVDRIPEQPNEFGRYMEGDPKAGLSKARWDAYRRVYAEIGVKLGIQRDAAHDAFVMVDSVGLLNRGHVTGYLYCAPGGPTDSDRFYACALHQDKGQRYFDPEKRQEAYSFERIDERWFAYDEGPS